MKIKFFLILLAFCAIVSCDKDEQAIIPEIRELRFCNDISSGNNCSGNTSVFSLGVEKVFVTAKVTSDPGKEVTFDYYLDGTFVGSETIMTLDGGNEFWTKGSLIADPGTVLPAGSYEVEVALEDGNSIARSFEIQ